MKIDTIKIENFRCFKNYEVSFGENATVLIGKNGSGKTTLISALKSAMSFIFSKYNGETEWEILGNTPDLHLVNLLKTDVHYDEKNKVYKYPVSIHCSAKWSNLVLDWSIVKKTANGRLVQAKYRDAFLSFTEFYNKDLKNSKLPVLAYFSDSYPHKKTEIRAYAKSVLKNGKFSRAFAYYQWDAESNCAEIWENRYISQYSKINDFKNNESETVKERTEVEFIDNKIKTFTKPLSAEATFINSEFEVKKIVLERPLKKDVFMKFIFSDNREILFEHLPQGYKRLISIVFDIAYRSYILNEAQEPEGVVFIDEIELHLHPSLQQEVLGRFQKTFPKIQFMVSTHSPLVISNLKADGNNNKIIKMENNGNHYENVLVENVFGLDYSTNLSEVMEVAPRASTIEKYINAYLFLYGKKKEEEANKVLDKLREYVGGEIPNLLQKEIDNQKKAYL